MGVVLSVLRLFILQSFPSATHVSVFVAQQVSIAIHLYKVLLSVLPYANDPFARTARTACHGDCHLRLVDSMVKEVEAVSSIELAQLSEEVRMHVVALLVQLVIIVLVVGEIQECVYAVAKGVLYARDRRLYV